MATWKRKKFYTTFDIRKIYNIKRETLRDWIDRDFVFPTLPAKGKGTKALFDEKAVFEIGLFKYLVGGGFTREMASKIVREVM